MKKYWSHVFFVWLTNCLFTLYLFPDEQCLLLYFTVTKPIVVRSLVWAFYIDSTYEMYLTYKLPLSHAMV